MLSLGRKGQGVWTTDKLVEERLPWRRVLVFPAMPVAMHPPGAFHPGDLLYQVHHPMLWSCLSKCLLQYYFLPWSRVFDHASGFLFPQLAFKHAWELFWVGQRWLKILRFEDKCLLNNPSLFCDEISDFEYLFLDWSSDRFFHTYWFSEEELIRLQWQERL